MYILRVGQSIWWEGEGGEKEEWEEMAWGYGGRYNRKRVSETYNETWRQEQSQQEYGEGGGAGVWEAADE